MPRNKSPRAFWSWAMRSVILLGIGLAGSVAAQNLSDTLQYGTQRHADLRSQAIQAYSPRMPADSPRLGSMTPAERRAAVDAYWGDGLSTAEKLKIFDIYWDSVPVKLSYGGPVAVLVGPGAVSSGDFGSELLRSLPTARTFGKSTSMALGLPTQPALGTVIDLGPDWDARVSESNSYAVGRPNDYLIHTEFPVDELVWLNPNDVAAGQETVVNAAMKWLKAQIGQ